MWSSDCHRVPNLHLCTKFYQNLMIFLLRYGNFTIFKMAAVLHLEFSKFIEFMSRDVYRHAIVSLCKISPKSDNRVPKYGQKQFSKWRPLAILNFVNFHIWSSGWRRVPNVQSCTKFHQNRAIFRRDMATICNITSVRYLEFSKFKVYFTLPLTPYPLLLPSLSFPSLA